ncbi:putative AmfS protein [Streptomyces sp. Tu6071]|nr:putative AmfS protein [Streptomyces sp. Tu6071]
MRGAVRRRGTGRLAAGAPCLTPGGAASRGAEGDAQGAVLADEEAHLAAGGDVLEALFLGGLHHLKVEQCHGTVPFGTGPGDSEERSAVRPVE